MTRVDPGAFDLPLYSAAIEANAFPPDAERLKALFVEQDSLPFVSPEYNGSLSPLLKKRSTGPRAPRATRGRSR
ncbi:MAG: NADPH-dependent FMN reductase [Sphingopyxis alaskensis]